MPFALFAICAAPVYGQSVAGTDLTSSATKAESSATQPLSKSPEPSPLPQMHYETRVRSFKDQNLIYQNVVLLGDSITEGFNVSKYLPGRRVLNRGIGGDVVGNHLPANDKRGLLKRLDESIFGSSPTDVFLLIGVNDLGQGHTPEVIEAGYRTMLARIRERLPQVKLHLQSVLPTRGNFAKHNPNILDLNRRIKSLASEFKADFIDLHSLFADEKGELKQELTNDGLHLLPEAYHLWASLLEGKLGWSR